MLRIIIAAIAISATLLTGCKKEEITAPKKYNKVMDTEFNGTENPPLLPPRP